MDREKKNREYFGKIIQQIKTKDNRCLWPLEPCSETSIRAHSIQNARVLDLLCDATHHVMMLQGRLDINIGPIIEFKPIGRNKATTFTGLCETHDNELFKPIDDNKFKPDNPEYLFLLAYRSVLREYHTKLKAAEDIQSIYLNGLNEGRFSQESEDPATMKATIALFEAYMFYLYKYEFDKIFLEQTYTQIRHKTNFVENIEPSIAVSSVYSYIDNIRFYNDRIDPKCLILNIFPQDKGLYIIFSFKEEHKSHLLPYITRILEAERHYKLYLISKLVLMYCENFVMSPVFYKTLSKDKIESIVNFFMKNMSTKKVDEDNSNFYLFMDES